MYWDSSEKNHRPQLTAPGPSISTLQVCPVPFCHLTQCTLSDIWKGPPAEALPAGQTLRPVEHKDWVNSSFAFLSGPTFPAETNAGRIPALCHGAINSGGQRGNNRTQLRCMTCRNRLSDKDELITNRGRDSLQSNISDWSRSEMHTFPHITPNESTSLLKRTLPHT